MNHAYVLVFKKFELLKRDKVFELNLANYPGSPKITNETIHRAIDKIDNSWYHKIDNKIIVETENVYLCLSIILFYLLGCKSEFEFLLKGKAEPRDLIACVGDLLAGANIVRNKRIVPILIEGSGVDVIEPEARSIPETSEDLSYLFT